MLSDGLDSYSLANRLASVNSTTTYAYNGLGDRLSQDAIHYTLDLNAGLTQVLDDGTDTYTYGLGRISQQSGNTPEYFLGDALGSMRQLTDHSGQVTYAKSYDPYGVVTNTSGASQSAYGYTGEQQDDSGLVYLRARYYVPSTGMFVNRDPSGFEQNLFLYASANPINRSDRTGLFSGLDGLGAFGLCFAIHSGSQVPGLGGGIGGGIILSDMTAQDAVNICKLAYNPTAWSLMPRGSELTSAHNLFFKFLNGTADQDSHSIAPGHLLFTARDRLTRELASSGALQGLRIEYTQFGDTADIKESKFNNSQQFACPLDYTSTAVSDINLGSIPLTCLLGSFYYQMKTIRRSDGNTYVGLRIDNRTDLESGTHIAYRYPDELYNGLSVGGSVEDLISSGQITGNEPILEVMNEDHGGRYVVSILSPKTSGSGANLQQTYVWMEKYDPCDPFSFTVSRYASSHDVMEWADWYPPTTQPIPGWDPNY